MVQEKPKSSIGFVLIGIFLVGVVTCLSFLSAYFFAFLYADFSGNATLLTWNRLVYLGLPVVFAFSLAYFSRRQIKYLLPIQLALITLVFLVTASIRLAQLSEQKQILQNYQQFIELVKRGKTAEANTFMLPDYQLAHETLDVRQHVWLEQAMNTGSVSSPYSVHIQSKDQAFIIPDPKTNQWYHPTEGFFLSLERLDGEWYFTGDGGLYLAD